MRITRWRLLIAVLCLYIVSAVLVLSSLRKLTAAEEKQVADQAGSKDEQQSAADLATSKLGNQRTSADDSADAASQRTALSDANLTKNSTILVKPDPNFSDDDPFYCELAHNARYNESQGDLDFLRAGRTDVYYLSEAYLDMRPGYRSPSIRVLAVVQQHANASFIGSSIQLCKTKSGAKQKSQKKKLKKHKLNARFHSVVKLSNFAYEFNENHNKPLRGYIITFQLDTTKIRLDAFPKHLVLTFGSSKETRVTIRVRKMMPATFRPEDTDEFKLNEVASNSSSSSANKETVETVENVPKKSFVHFNAPVDVDGRIARLNAEWNKRYAHSYRHEFATCVPPLFGTVDIRRLIEFIEVHRLLGVSRFVFYIYKLKNAAEVESLLTWYGERLSNESKRNDSMVIWKWKMPFEEGQIWYHGQLLAVHHCLYENAGISRYVSFNDIDEAIVPRNFKTWHKLFKKIDVVHEGRIAKPAGFRFRGAFFDTNKPGLPLEDVYIAKLFGTEPPVTTATIRKKVGPVVPPAPGIQLEVPALLQPHIVQSARRFIIDLVPAGNTSQRTRQLLAEFGELRFVRFVERNDPPTRVRTKCIVKPDFVFEMGIHHVSKQHVEEMEPREVEEGYAMLQHYRTCETSYDVTCGSFMPEYALVKMHKRQLYLNLVETLNALPNVQSLLYVPSVLTDAKH